MRTTRLSALLAVFLLVCSCASDSEKRERGERAAKSTPERSDYPEMGKVERVDPALDELIAPDAKLERIAEGFEWSEGPVWMRGAGSGFLLFSDVPKNVVHKWDPAEGAISDYLKPSGYTGDTPRGGEPGSNGLTIDKQGRLVLCQHGDRRVVRVEKDGKWTTLADRYQGKRFNSPNDLVFDRKGNLYFTDPPYGMEQREKDPKRELDYCGVYLVRPGAKEPVLLTKEFDFPNGIALSPDEKTLYVAQSDPKRPYITAFDVKEDGTITNSRTFFDTSPLREGRKGGPDGLKVDMKGNVWTTGPGGVLVISRDGKHLGTIFTGEATANCGWGGDGSTLYLTADMYLCRIRTKNKGKMP